jgi:uncharacterized protein YbcI
MEAVARLDGGELNAALTKALVGIQTEQLDRGPTSAIAFHRGNVVVAVMHDVLTPAERALAQNGSHNDIDQARAAFPAGDGGRLPRGGRAIDGRCVVAFFGVNHLEPDVAAEIFVLDEPV